ncbi:MAG: type II secretion system F family protein [Rhodoferax sp.]
MAYFQYRAASADGRVAKGRIEALHETDLAAQLKRLDLVLISAKEVASKRGSVKSLTRREVLGILFQLEMLVRAGVPILDALADLRDASDTPGGRDLAGNLYERIEAGSTLGDAVGHFPGVFSATTVSLIRSGELAGQLPDVLREIVRSLKWQDEMLAQTKKLVAYPAFVLVVIGGVVFFLMIYLVPQLVGFLRNMGQEMPLQTRALLGLSNLFVEYWWAILALPPLLVAAVTALAGASEGFRYQLHAWVLVLPVVGPVLKKMTLARFADTLGLMYRTGIPLIDSLSYCETVSGNLVIRRAIQRARERVLTGTALSDAFATEDMFPPFVIRMLRVGESTGALDGALANISYFYSRDIDESISRVQAMIEPALTVVMGLILGWIMLAVLGPIYDTITKMKT